MKDFASRGGYAKTHAYVNKQHVAKSTHAACANFLTKIIQLHKVKNKR